MEIVHLNAFAEPSALRLPGPFAEAVSPTVRPTSKGVSSPSAKRPQKMRGLRVS
jgi:hypothetical protein